MRETTAIIVPRWVLTLAPVVGTVISLAIGFGVAKASISEHTRRIDQLETQTRHNDRETMQTLFKIERNLSKLCEKNQVNCE